jgi:hypothetical protein
MRRAPRRFSLCFRGLAPIVDDVVLKQKLRVAGDTKDASLAISTLDGANYELRRVLIELQTKIESLSGPDAREAERRIWSVLKASAERRVVRLPAI